MTRSKPIPLSAYEALPLPPNFPTPGSHAKKVNKITAATAKSLNDRLGALKKHAKETKHKQQVDSTAKKLAKLVLEQDKITTKMSDLEKEILSMSRKIVAPPPPSKKK